MSARVINKLILFVSEACNLKCRYCYVMLPGACQKAMMMSEDTARRIARQIFAQNGSCGFVQFFGGEPTLNMPALRAFVAEVFRIVNEGSGVRLPQFGLVTNGASRHVRELEDFCREYRIGVTVSLDGFKSIHDALRPSAKGTGSFDDAVMTIESLLRAQVPVAIETVYTSLHIDRQCSIVDLFKLTQDLGVRKLVFHTAYPPAPAELCPFDDAHFDRLKNYHIEAVDAWFASLISESPNHLDVYFKDLLVPLLQGGVPVWPEEVVLRGILITRLPRMGASTLAICYTGIRSSTSAIFFLKNRCCLSGRFPSTCAIFPSVRIATRAIGASPAVRLTLAGATRGFPRSASAHCDALCYCGSVNGLSSTCRYRRIRSPTFCGRLCSTAAKLSQMRVAVSLVRAARRRKQPRCQVRKCQHDQAIVSCWLLSREPRSGGL